ncbi:hypothetical protein ALC56_07104, partial [Trachymyrmex septentrionalis]
QKMDQRICIKFCVKKNYKLALVLTILSTRLLLHHNMQEKKMLP